MNETQRSINCQDMASATPLLLPDAVRSILALMGGINPDDNPEHQYEGWRTRGPNIRFAITEWDTITSGSTSVSVTILVHAFVHYSLSPEKSAFYIYQRLQEDAATRDLLASLVENPTNFLSPQNITETSPMKPTTGNTWRSIAEKLETSLVFKKRLHLCANEIFRNLLLPMRAQGGTPSTSTTSGSDSGNHRQSNFRELLFRRDGHVSVIGRVGNIEAPPGSIPAGSTRGREPLEACHIIPFTASSNVQLRTLLGIFSGNLLDDDDLVGNKINDPSNGFMATHGVHYCFDSFRLSIESTSGGYRLRIFVSDALPEHVLKEHHDDDPLVFAASDPSISMPNPVFCNLHSRIAKVLHASGMAETVDRIIQEEEVLKVRSTDGSEWGQRGCDYINRKLEGLMSS